MCLLVNLFVSLSAQLPFCPPLSIHLFVSSTWSVRLAHELTYLEHLKICLSVCLSIYPSIHPSNHPSIHLSTYLTIYLPRLSFHLSISVSIPLSIYPSIHPPIYLLIYLCIYLFFVLFIYPSIHPSIDPFIHLSVYSSIYPSIDPSIRPSFYLFIFCSFFHSSFLPFIFGLYIHACHQLKKEYVRCPAPAGVIPTSKSPCSMSRRPWREATSFVAAPPPLLWPAKEPAFINHVK